MKVSKYNNSVTKRLLDILLSILILILSAPLFVLTSFLVLLTSGLPVFYVQNRTGKNGKTFKIFKFRTMINGADKLQKRFAKLNESSGVVFKIRNDPRFTKIGKVISSVGIDELPQFINVLKGDMSIVGPRPLPTYEADRLSSKQKVRELIRPGITSTWVINGTHQLAFNEWMALDKKYIHDASIEQDLKIIFSTLILMLQFLLKL